MNIWVRLITLLFVSLILFLATTTAFAYLTLFERRILARLQNRVGPNRAGPGGFFQPLADALKLFFKEEITPAQADKAVYTIAPALAMIPAIVLFAVIPFGAYLDLSFLLGEAARYVPIQLADVNVGVLFLLAVTSIGVYGVTLGGWSSNNKYSMLGGIRAAAQMVSYELALGLSILVAIMLTTTPTTQEAANASLCSLMFGQQPVAEISALSTCRIVESQGGWWNIFKPTGLLAFGIFWLASTAEVVRAPFDLVEAEQELVGGFNTEYSSMKFALFFMAEYIKLIAISAIGVVLFLGGWRGPGVDLLYSLGYPNVAGLVSLGYFLLKLIAFLFFSIWVRATLPRFKYNQLMDLGWKRLLPISLGLVAVTAVFAVVTQDMNPYIAGLFGGFRR
ncbi:MAG: NADH-quinone oxidoreductase subunit H [Chloroflexi bacterium]|nr:MAG: NADH-quinone oxidoreductase subunit H [Chloroflexota bacterium]